MNIIGDRMIEIKYRKRDIHKMRRTYRPGRKVMLRWMVTEGPVNDRSTRQMQGVYTVLQAYRNFVLFRTPTGGRECFGYVELEQMKAGKE